MSSYRTLACISSAAFVLVTVACQYNSVLAQPMTTTSRLNGVYGDSDSLRGIEEQARRRSRAEAEAASADPSVAIRAKLAADVRQINSESAAEYTTIYNAYRQLLLRDSAGMRQNSDLPAYLQRQFSEITLQDINRFDAEVQRLKDSNRARIEYATLANQRQNLQILRDAQQHEAAAQQGKVIDSNAKIYDASLERLRESRARVSQLNANRESLVRSYNQGFTAWENVRSQFGSGEPEGSNGYVGSGEDNYDLAGALRDKLQGLNSGYGH